MSDQAPEHEPPYPGGGEWPWLPLWRTLIGALSQLIAGGWIIWHEVALPDGQAEFLYIGAFLLLSGSGTAGLAKWLGSR